MKKIFMIVITVATIVISLSAHAKDSWKNLFSTAPSEEELSTQKTDVVIKHVIPNSPAAKADIRVGDMIVTIEEKPVEWMKSASDLLENANNSVVLLLNRGGVLFKKNISLNPQPPRLGAVFFDGEVGILDDKTKQKIGCRIFIGDISLVASVEESKQYYRVWLNLKNIGKKPITAPYRVMLQDNYSSILKLMTPQELLYAMDGNGENVYVPSQATQLPLPTSYTVSSTSTANGNIISTHSVITPHQEMYNFQQGMNSLGHAIAMIRAAKAVANRQNNEAFVNNNYLKRTEIPADALYQGVLFFAKSPNNAQGAKLTTYIDENKSGTCNFISASEKMKMKKHSKD